MTGSNLTPEESEAIDRVGEVVRAAKAQAWIKAERRERIATAVFAGFASDPKWPHGEGESAKIAVAWANALIAELDRP